MVHVFKTEKYENNFTMKCFDWHVTWYLLTSYQPDPTALIILYYICFRIAIFFKSIFKPKHKICICASMNKSSSLVSSEIQDANRLIVFFKKISSHRLTNKLLQSFLDDTTKSNLYYCALDFQI